MTQPVQLKRQLLRKAVEENVSTIEGRVTALPAPDAGRPARFAAGRVAVVVTLLLLIPATLLLLRRPQQAQADAPAPPTAAAPAPAAAVEDPASQLTFPAPRPIDSSVFPLEVRRIVIDPGHGGDDLGTSGGGLTEKDLTLDIAQRLRANLERDGYEIHLTRDSDTRLSLRERAEIANRLGSDLFLSIHINWLATRQVRGIETYYLGPTEDPELTELARQENRHSGYTLAEMRLLVDSIYTDLLQSQAKSFAGRVQRSLFTSLLRDNPQLENRGVKTAPFVVLVSTEMPAILTEVSCLSNDKEAELLSRPLYREHIAEALARGVRGYADDVNQTEKGT